MNHKYDLSILIPARNEEFLSRTVENILKNKRGSTEVLVALDGQWADPPVAQHPDVTVIYFPESIGQRAATNRLAAISQAKYVMKVDAHCNFDEGFDFKMMTDMRDDYTMAPLMKHLHVFDWKCPKCGSTWDQGPTPTHCMLRTGRDGKEKVINPNCDNTEGFERIIFFEERISPTNSSYCFDATPHFQYFNEYRNRPEYQEGKKKLKLTESMSLQGSCFMLTRDKYWELNICDESFGSWGSQGIEVACKTWLSGGKVIINHHTWYAHLFRTQGGDFGFPYPNATSSMNRAKAMAKEIFFNGKWDKQKLPVSWLLEKFWPVPGWTDEDLANLKLVEKGEIHE